MAEGTYESECQRAELLGIEPPKFEDWQEAERVRLEQLKSAEAEELEHRDEQINETTGKIGELTNILSVTQQRINKFKRACGSLQNLLKIRGGADDIESNESDGDKNDDGNKLTNPNEGNASAPITPAKRSSNDMEQKMSSQVDNLDSLLTKVENAHYSMSHQKKQMKSMLQK